MPPDFEGFPFGMRGPPLESLALELVYFLAVAAICLIIYFKAKDIYRISQHRGLYYFKNIFLFFSLSYFFRLIHLTLMISQELFSLDMPWFAMRLTLFFVTYSSTMAILSVAMAALIRNLKESGNGKAHYLLHAIAIALSLLVAVPRSESILILLQTVLLFGAVLFVFLKPGREKPKKIISQNRMTYLLLAVFWILNLLAFNRRMVPLYIEIPLYILSVGVFLSILLRVRKRLHSDAGGPGLVGKKSHADAGERGRVGKGLHSDAKKKRQA